jgi:hypothetical protein
MKTSALLLLLFFSTLSFAQDQKFSLIDFVQIIDNNKEEAVYYYQNNWKQLRISALEKGYIESYQLLETEATEDAPFELILITTFSNETQFAKREENFQELITARGELKLLNDKKPGEFRSFVFSKDMARHID